MVRMTLNHHSLKEDTMKAPSIVKERIQVDLADEGIKFTFRIGAVICGLIGIWAVTCLLAGLIGFGPVAMVKGYISAITGL
jgi:hypothetical protein